jgi:hypothetical protein
MGIAVGLPYGGSSVPGMAQGLPLGVPPPLARPAPALTAPQANMHVRIAEPVAPALPAAAAPAAARREDAAAPAEHAAAPPQSAAPPPPRAPVFAQSTLDIREAEAQAAAAAEERNQAAARDASASQLALKAASKILATKAKKRQSA